MKIEDLNWLLRGPTYIGLKQQTHHCRRIGHFKFHLIFMINVIGYIFVDGKNLRERENLSVIRDINQLFIQMI